MRENSEGFLCPKIDDKKCTKCGLCEKRCPALHFEFRNTGKPDCYAAMASDEVRFVSSSGGLFTLVADYVLEHGGYVCGAEFSPDFRTLRHVVIDNSDKLPPLKKSKYVQSDTKIVFKEIKALLEKTNKPVLFSGCPCQVAGLYNFLGKEYENLITFDLVCHGAPSPKGYQAYLDDIRGNKKVINVDFRCKHYGWGTPIEVTFDDNTRHTRNWNEEFYTLFWSGAGIRTSCNFCQYACLPRVGDITLGDFWGVRDAPEYRERLNDNKGTSLLLINNDKGNDILKKVSKKLKLKEIMPLDFAINTTHNLHQSIPYNDKRHVFFNNIDKIGFFRAAEWVQLPKRKIGVVGWWYGGNYGSVATYFALYSFLKDLGSDVTEITNPWRKEYPPDEKRSVEFAKKHIKITQYRIREQLFELNNYFDTFMLGADQLWNYETGYSHFHMLDFAENCKRKIALSTSFGHEDLNFPEEIFPEVKMYMQRLTAVSVRESSGVDNALNGFGINAKLLLDPVFLCDKRHYEKIADDATHKTSGKFVFGYILDPTKQKVSALKFISKKLKLPIITITDGQIFDSDEGIKKASDSRKLLEDCGFIENASQEDWIYHFKNAEFVLTDSFHGSCFSVIFNKPFIALDNEFRGSTRFVELFTRLNILNRYLAKPEEVSQKPELLNSPDYQAVNAIIKTHYLDAVDWTLQALRHQPIYDNKVHYGYSPLVWYGDEDKWVRDSNIWKITVTEGITRMSTDGKTQLIWAKLPLSVPISKWNKYSFEIRYKFNTNSNRLRFLICGMDFQHQEICIAEGEQNTWQRIERVFSAQLCADSFFLASTDFVGNDNFIEIDYIRITDITANTNEQLL
jgi:coenzyme F420-reducing hydrogenase beta subunit